MSLAIRTPRVPVKDLTWANTTNRTRDRHWARCSAGSNAAERPTGLPIPARR